MGETMLAKAVRAYNEVTEIPGIDPSTRRVRAVIASLREPSEAVEDAGCDLVWQGSVKPAVLWTAMIDAILTEEPKA